MLGDGIVIWRAAGIWEYHWQFEVGMLIPLLADFSKRFGKTLTEALMP